MRPPPLNLLGLAPLARPPGWCQLPPTLGCPPGPGGVSTDLQAVLVETSKATRPGLTRIAFASEVAIPWRWGAHDPHQRAATGGLRGRADGDGAARPRREGAAG